jgi:outer membrane protein assembly factor BamB
MRRLRLCLAVGAAAVLVTGIGISVRAGAASQPRTAGASATVGGTDWLQFAFSPDKRADNTQEHILNPGNVGRLQTLFNVTLPDAPDGAPVLLTNVTTPMGARDVAYVKGEHGHLWAFDARTGQQIWMRNLNNGCTGCFDNSAPAIGPDRQFIYAGGFDGKVHKLRIGDGSEVTGGGWPEVSTTPMTGGSRQKFSMELAWATARDGHPYLYAGHSVGGSGHFTAVNLDTGTQHVYNNSCSEKPDIHPGVDGTCARTGAHPWSRSAVFDPSLDRVFLDSGSNNNNQFIPGTSWPDTYQALPPDGRTRVTGGKGFPADSYTPTDWQNNESRDQDMASGGMQLLPVGINAKFPHLGAILGKDHRIKLVNTADLSGKHGPGNTGGELQMIQTEELNMIRSFSAGWTNPADGTAWIFVAAEKGLEAFRLVADAAGNPRLERRWMATHGFTASPVVANNMVFAAFGAGEHSPTQPFKHIQALDPTTGRVLWDAPTIAHHWSSPIVANGVVYLAQGAAGDRQAGTSGLFTAWALPCGTGCGGNNFSLSVTPTSQTATPGSTVRYTVKTAVTSGVAEDVTLAVTGLPPGSNPRFAPNPVRAGQSATLTATIPAGTTLGNYALTIDGTSPSASHSAAASLDVASALSLITNLSVKDTANAADWSVQKNLQVGDRMYGDRTYTFKIVFDRVVAAEWIRPANDSKAFRGNPLVTFMLTGEAEVNVAMDRRAGRPTWIDATWEDRGTTLTSSNGVTYELFRKTMPAGAVALGPMSGSATSTSQYVVIVQSSTAASIADTAIDNWYDLSHAGPDGGPLND